MKARSSLQVWTSVALRVSTIALLLFGTSRPALNQGAAQPVSVSIAVGTERNYYTRFCEAFQDVARKTSSGIQVTCIPTQGSVDNVYAMTRGNADFALIQSDVAHRVWYKDPPFAQDNAGPNIRLVSPLFTEKIHIVVRPHQYLTSISGLQNKRIWLGPENSGNRIAATNLLAAAGLTDGFSVVDAMNQRQALTLLGGKLHNGPQLDIAIDAMPTTVDALSGMLLRLGVKSTEITVPDSHEHLAVLFRPDLTVGGVADLRDKKVWLGPNLPSKSSSSLRSRGFLVPTNGNTRTALARLMNHEIDAIVDSSSINSDLVSAIFEAGRFTVTPVAPDPRSNGKKMLLAMARPGLDGPLLPLKPDLHVWWPEGDATLDEVVLDRLLGPYADDAARQKLMLGRRVGGSGAMKLLQLGELDAVFETTVARNPIVFDLMKETEVSLLGLDWPEVERLEEDGSYVETSLQRNVYPALDHGIFTVGIQTLLVTRLGETPEDQAKVAAVARLLSEQLASIEKGITQRDPDYGKFPMATFRLILVGSPVKRYLMQANHLHIHPAALSFLIKPGHLRKKTEHLLWIIAVTILICGGAAIVLERKQWLARYHRTGILVTLSLILFWMLAAVWLQAVEGDVTQDYSSLSGSAASFFKNVASHFELPVQGPPPTTRAGQTALDIFSWLGVALVATFLLPLRAQISSVVLWLLGRKKDDKERS